MIVRYVPLISVLRQSCTLNGNSASGDGLAGGIYNDANGGYGMATLTLKNSTLSNNSASGGGGVSNSTGTLTMESCTLSNNSATSGGGISTNYGAATLTNCTLSGNSASGDGGGISGAATLTNCTLSGNSASGHGGGTSGAALVNTIIANSPHGGNCSSPQQDNGHNHGHNLDDDGSCGFFNAGDLSIVPPQLAPLGDYGGPTQTYALCTRRG
jgi:parallel beta-helix repeat protein